MKASVFVFGVLAAVVAGGATALLLGDLPGYIVAAVLVVIAIAAFFVSPNALKGMLTVVLVALVGGLAVAAWGTTTVIGALGDTSGPVTEPDSDDLAADKEQEKSKAGGCTFSDLALPAVWPATSSQGSPHWVCLHSSSRSS